MPEDKQTNGPGALALSLHLYFQLVRPVGLLPLTRTLPRPCCWNKAPTVHACSGESARDNVMLPSTQAAIEGQVEVRWEREWGLGRLSGVE